MRGRQRFRPWQASLTLRPPGQPLRDYSAALNGTGDAELARQWVRYWLKQCEADGRWRDQPFHRNGGQGTHLGFHGGCYVCEPRRGAAIVSKDLDAVTEAAVRVIWGPGRKQGAKGQA